MKEKKGGNEEIRKLANSEIPCGLATSFANSLIC